MKAPAFAYKSATSLAETTDLLQSNEGSKLIAGGQTLGPMLNLRLTNPPLLIDVTRIRELTEVHEMRGWVKYGACVTHANFEDSRVPDPTGGYLARVAKGIAYRAVRTRGTMGGSIAHCDPAADWLAALLVLDAEVDISAGTALRSVTLQQFIKGPLLNDLRAGELVSFIRIGRPSPGERFGYAKLCRKTGEFADAIGAVRRYANGKVRLISGSGDRPPIVIENGADFIAGRGIEREPLWAYLIEQGVRDEPYSRAIHVTALQRALDESAGR